MKSKMTVLAAIAMLLLTVNFAAICKTPVKPSKSNKVSHSARYKMSVAEMTKNLQFDFAKDNFSPNYDDRLDQLAKLLIDGKYPVVLRGHADAIGTYVGNWKLSERRAVGIKNYLVKKGVPAQKIVTTPFGSTIPIATNSTPEGRQKNRRVEIKIGDNNNG